MAEGNEDSLGETAMASPYGELNRTELNQVLTNHLRALINQRSSAIESQEQTTQQDSAVETNRIALLIGAIAAGGGIYLETIGQVGAGTTILVVDVLLSSPLVYSSIVRFIDRRRTGR